MSAAAIGSGYVILTIAGETYAIDVKLVEEVVEPLPVIPIPRAPTHFAGAITSHGRLKPVLDLARFYKGKSCSPQGRVILLEEQFANLALWVDEVSFVAAADGPRVSVTPATTDRGHRSTVINGRETVVLDLDHLLHGLEETING